MKISYYLAIALMIAGVICTFVIPTGIVIFRGSAEEVFWWATAGVAATLVGTIWAITDGERGRSR